MSATNKPSKIYLAGPDVFLPEPLKLAEAKKKICAIHGFEGRFPLDNVIENFNPNKETGLRISQANEVLISECDSVIAHITPFRGPSADVGTAYEMGFARARGLTVCAYSNDASSFADRTAISSGPLSRKVSCGALLDRDGLEVEEFDMVDNLMLEGGVLASGGLVAINDVPAAERYTNLNGFEQCVIHLRQLVERGVALRN